MGTRTMPAAPGAAARMLVRAADRASLATAMVEGGWPYASLVVVACDHAGAPLLMISDLAEHAKNLKATRGRCALLFDGTAGHDNPLMGPRVTVLGRLVPSDDDLLLARFLAHHPDADTYAGLGDFHLYRMTVDRAHLVAGFGRISWIPAANLLFDVADAPGLARDETEILTHMNEDHGDAVQLYAEVLLGREAGDWRLTGVDPEGADLRAGPRIARLCFEEPVRDAAEMQNTLITLVKRARDARERPS